MKHDLRFRLVLEIWAVLEFMKFLYLFISILGSIYRLVKEGKNMFFEIIALCWPKCACCSIIAPIDIARRRTYVYNDFECDNQYDKSMYIK